MSPQMTRVHLIDISLHAANRRDWGSKENVAASEVQIGNQEIVLKQPVRCASRRFLLVDDERVLRHVVRVGVDIDLSKLLQLLGRLWGGMVALWSIRVYVCNSWGSSWT